MSRGAGTGRGVVSVTIQRASSLESARSSNRWKDAPSGPARSGFATGLTDASMRRKLTGPGADDPGSPRSAGGFDRFDAMPDSIRSIAIAGAWGYIGRKLVDAGLRAGLEVHVLDPGPVPPDFDPGRVHRVDDADRFYALEADLFHLALHPEARKPGLTRLLARTRSEALWILNEKPMVAPEEAGEAGALVEAVDRSRAVMLFDFPELFDPLTHRIIDHLSGFREVVLTSIEVERSKDREDPDLARNFKRMLPIQFQESVHCLAFVLFVLASLRKTAPHRRDLPARKPSAGIPDEPGEPALIQCLESVLAGGLQVSAESQPYDPPNPDDYPHIVDGRCDYRLTLGRLSVAGRTNFKRGAPWSKRRLLRGTADGRPLTIEADYLEGGKWLRIDGIDQAWDRDADSYAAILATIARWRQQVSRETLLTGIHPNPRLARLALQLSGALWRSSRERRSVEIPNLEALQRFASGFREARPQLPKYPDRAR